MRFKRFIMLVLVTAMVTGMLPVNASLTAETNDYSIEGWRVRSSYSDSAAYIDRSEVALGEASLKLVNKTPAGTDKFVQLETTAQVKKGKRYTLEFDAKADDLNEASMSFNWGARSSLTPGEKTYDWTKFMFTYVPTQDETVAIRYFCLDKSGALWLDNVKFYDKEKPDDNLLINGDFENCSGPTEPEIHAEVSEPAGETDMHAVAAKINVDGKTDDWAGIDAVPIVGYQDFTQYLGSGPASELTADIKFAYDDKNLYFVISAQDEVHVVENPTVYWNGDGIQFATADARISQPYLTERGVTYNPQTGEVYTTNGNFTAAASRNGETTIYEVALPWTNDFGAAMPDKILFNALINQNDGNGRSYCMEITPGISATKDATQFNVLFLDKELNGVYYSIGTPNEVLVGESGAASLILTNRSNTEKSIEIKEDTLGFTETLKLSPGEKRTISLGFVMQGKDGLDLKLSLSDGSETATVSKTIDGYIDYELIYPEFKARIEGYIAELKELLLECEEKGINPEYEIASYSIICKYLEYANYIAERGDYSLFGEFDRVLTREYEETTKKLKEYLNGEKEPLAVPRYVLSDIKIDGTSVTAKTETNGVVEERPVFFTGYGHWQTAWDEIPFFSNLGFNAIQAEVHVSDGFAPIKLSGWSLGASKGDISVIEANVTSEDKVSGSNSLKVINPEGLVNNRYLRVQQNVKVKPDTTYVYGIKAKANGTNGKGAFFTLHGFGVDGTGRQWIADSDEWKAYNFQYTTGADETELDVSIFFQDKIESMYIDDFYIMEEGTNINLIKNGDFEEVPVVDPKYEKYDKEAEGLGFYIDYSCFDDMRSVLERAEQNNFYVDLGTTIHSMPEFIKARDPEITANGTNTFIPFTVDHELVRKVSSLWSRLAVAIASEYDCVGSICITNEPGIKTRNGEHYVPAWREYLKETHGTIEALNAKYGSDYKSFDEVDMPDSDKEPTPLYYDYRCFNDQVNAEFHQFLTSEIRKEFPDILLQSKVMGYFRYNGDRYFNNGANWELFADSFDLNSNDAHAQYGAMESPMYAKMAWYDFQTSVKDAPVWDTESHISVDREVVLYDDLVEYWSGADVWNGAIHGRGTSVMWLWDLKEFSMPWGARPGESFCNANAALRPADVVQTSKAAMDLNRLSKEVAAIQKAEKKVGILYSRTSHGYLGDIMESTLAAYQDVIFSGQKAGFITETKPETIYEYDLVIIPETPNVPDKVVESIKGYIDNGGKVIIADDSALKYDEYNNPRDKTLVDYIYSKSEVNRNIHEKIEEMKLSDVMLVNAETGERIDNVEWVYAEYNGDIVVSICNYDRVDSVDVKVRYKDNEVKGMKELRSDEMLQDKITLKPYQPVLIRFEK